jgi:AraC-like DNA-binding protein
MGQFSVGSGGIRRYSGEHRSHIHDHAQLLLGVRGRMELEINGHSTYVDSSCGLIIPAGVAHGFCAPVNARVYVLDTPTEIIAQRVKRFAATPKTLPYLATGNPLIFLDELMGMPQILARRGLDISQLDRALTHSLHEPWPTARMAALFCMSTPHFHTRLRELTGRTPQSYLRNLRLSAAIELLQRGLAQDSVALQLGYASASALSHALQRDRGFSIRHWRSK